MFTKSSYFYIQGFKSANVKFILNIENIKYLIIDIMAGKLASKKCFIPEVFHIFIMNNYKLKCPMLPLD